ncbi:MAG: ThiF family adenylyltransferase [Candidatus Lokiarchaeota archaeon]
MNEESNFFDKSLSNNERELYDRQFRLEGWSQKLLKESKVLIAGVGGLGCEIAKNLAMVGVGTIYLVDMDIIEHSNLNRQILFIDAKIGEPKAIAAAKKLRQINPYIKVKGFSSSLERMNPKAYKVVDLVVGGLDSMNARLNLNAQCVRFNKPLVDGGVSGYHGHLYTIFPYENACYECNPLPTTDSDEMAACTVVGIPRKRVHCVFKGNMLFKEKTGKDPDPKNEKHIEFIQKEANRLAEKHNFLPLFSKTDVIKIVDRHDPGIITINAVISSLQSHEAIKILHWQKGNNALGAPLKDYLIFNGMTMKFYRIEKKRNPDCFQCGEKVRRMEIHIKREESSNTIIEKIKNKGYKVDPYMEPILTLLDFNDIKIINLNKTILENKLRDYELITAAGFEGGEIFITLRIN